MQRTVKISFKKLAKGWKASESDTCCEFSEHGAAFHPSDPFMA